MEFIASRLRHTFTQGMHSVQKSCTLACMHDGTGLRRATWHLLLT